MKVPRISFGTDGWYGVAGEEVSDENIARVVYAFLDHLRSALPAVHQIKVAVAFDGRKDSRRFAELSARVLSAHGLDVLFSNTVVPTPVLSFITKEFGCAGGIMITGGRYPAKYNGIKLRNEAGGALSHLELEKVEAAIAASGPTRTLPDLVPTRIETLDPLPRYVAHLKSMIDLPAIEAFARDPKNTASVLIDSMGGAGQTIIEDILAGCGWRAQTLFGEAQPGFFDRSPEAVSSNLAPLKYNVSVTDSQCGIATDGDGSSVGLVSNRGDWISDQESMLALLIHLHDHRGQSGAIVKGFAVSDKVNTLARLWNLPLKQVGFELMSMSEPASKEGILLAGGEGGRFVFPGHIPGPDAILSGLMIIEMIAKAGKPLQSIIQSISQRVGVSYCDQIEIPYAGLDPLSIMEGLSKKTGVLISGREVKQCVTIKSRGELQGVKLIFGDSQWIAARLSDVVPTFRLTAEGCTQEELDLFLTAAKNLLPS